MSRMRADWCMMRPMRSRSVAAIRCLAVVTALAMCPCVGAQATPGHGPDWVRVTERAPWPPRDSQGEFVHDGHLWIVGGWVTPQSPNLLDVWKSPDGKSWTRALEAGPWVQADLPVSLTFQGKMWLMGGRKVPGSVCSNRVWSSSDGVAWGEVSAGAGWSPRLAPGFAVFHDRMWVLGGTSDFYNNNDQTLFNDVWSSADGKDWKRETASAPWSKRAHGQVLAFDNNLWVIGGGTRAPKAVPTNDVWRSADGVNWTEVTSAAPWKSRLWFSSAVYRGRMWVLGGWTPDGGNLGDVWHSKDGRNWTELKSRVIWTKRHEHSAFVFQDKLWVAGGAAEPAYKLSAEVWSLELPRDWSGE